MKTYVLIGGNSGVARALALQLAEDGNRIITTGREEWNGPSLDNHQHFTLNAVTEPDQLEWPDVVDGLVYAPGSINLKPFRGLKDDDFLSDFEINAMGAVRVLRAAYSRLKKSESPSVVLFSTVAVEQGMPFHSSIAMAKGAVEGLVRSLAAEWAPAIRVNAVAPSLTDTPLASSLLANDKRKEASAERHPLKKYGQPKDIAEAAYFLLSERSSWMSGQILHVDGGMSRLRV